MSRDTISFPSAIRQAQPLRMFYDRVPLIVPTERLIYSLAISRVLTTKYLPKGPYPAIILVEPSVVAKELFEATIDDRMEQMEFVVRMTMARRDHWASKDEAFAWLSKRYPWSTWDTRVVKLFAVGSV